MLFRSRLPLLTTVILISCSSNEGTAPTSTTNAVARVPVSANKILAQLESFAPIRDALKRRHAVELREEGFVRTDVAKMAGLAHATLPRTVNAPMHIVPRKNEDAWIDVRSLDVESSPGALHDNAVVYEDVAPSTDVVITAEGTRVEETRLLRDEKASSTFRYRIELGPAIVDAHVRSGMVELADASGYTHLSTDVAYAVDAKGVRRELKVTLEGTGSTRTMVASLDTKGLAYPIAVDPVWTSSPNMPGGPGSNIAIALNSGKIFAAGGYSPITCIYTPSTNTWVGGTSAGIPNAPIDYGPYPATMRGTKLASGKILIVAGGTTDRRVAIYDETTNAYTVPANQQINVCNGCQLVTLPSGYVFKTSNLGTGATELYNPTTNAWTAQAASPIVSGGDNQAVALKGTYAGRVLQFGGSPAQTAAIWNSATNTWAASIFTRRFNLPRVIPLADGRGMVIGGPSGSGSPPAVGIVIAPATNSYTDTAISPVAMPGVSGVLLSSGLVLAAGGETGFGTSTINTLSTSAIYDPIANTWSTIDALAISQAEHQMVEANDKSVLAVGGIQNYGGPTVQSQKYTPLAQGTSCASPLKPQTCVTGYCVNNVCCTSASCPNGVCNAPAVTGRAAGVCALNNGQACTANAQCASNFCVDGVCCNAACGGQCEACNLAGTAGTCTPVTGAPTGGRPACSGVGAGTACGSTCNGVIRTGCTYAPAGTVACGSASCTGGVMTTPSKCDGKGVCPGTSSSCGAYACGPSSCLTTCTNDAFCAAGYYCDVPSSTCVAKTGLGATCSGPSMCSSGTFCVDGVCCGVASCGAGSSCALGTTGGPIKPGTCSKVNGTACAADAECGSQHCIDGVCCDTACTEQCAACDVKDKVGTCSPVSGPPHGSRMACEDGKTTGKCAARQCDGTSSTSACNGFVYDGTEPCEAASCMGSTLIPAALCDGAGSCTKPTPSACGKYTCDPTALACRTSCTADSDCANEAKCRDGKCTDAASCSQDGTQSIDPVTKVPQDCAPFKCDASGSCAKNCATTSDCVTGFVCDTSSGSGLCVAAPGDTAESGGCALATPSGRTSSGLALGALLAAAIVARMRRRLN